MSLAEAIELWGWDWDDEQRKPRKPRKLSKCVSCDALVKRAGVRCGACSAAAIELQHYAAEEEIKRKRAESRRAGRGDAVTGRAGDKEAASG